jgi:hypothetical protein
MLRPTLLALALTCAIPYNGSAQQAASPSTMPTAQSTSAEAAKTTTPPASSVSPGTPVLTLKGACPPKNGVVPKGCTSSLTRQQFEDLTGALQPADKGPVPPDVRRRFATQYAKLLILSDAAREAGLENDPKVQQIFTFARNQILAEALNQHFMETYSHPTDQQIQAYYDQNKKKYLEATLQRIIIPMPQQGPDKPKPDPEAQKALAEKTRQAWIAGGDAAQLEKDAMDASDMKTAAPDVNIGARRPGSLPEAHEGVFELKAGEFSPVYSDPAAFYVYKVVSVREVPLSEVKAQITQTVQRQQYNEKLEAIQKAVTPELNDAYFGPEQPQAMQPNMIHPGMPPRPAGAPGAPPPPPANSGTSPH